MVLAVLGGLFIALWAIAALAWSMTPKNIALVPTPAAVKEKSLVNKILGFDLATKVPLSTVTAKKAKGMF
jgi:hypothetical protein